eukprot:gene61026-81363_t
MFAGADHPGTVHGQQVGVASLVMARLQHKILSMPTPPRVAATVVDEAAMRRRYPGELGGLCIAEMKKTAMDAAQAEAFNAQLEALWPTLRPELTRFAMPASVMESALRAAGGPTTGEELGVPRAVWHDAIRYSREIRGRWSFVNLAADAGRTLMQPVAALPASIARNLVGVFTDIDDTLTTEGRLPAAAYQALEALHAAGLIVVPITGRPAGWCDMIARFWPVAGVIGENGAFYYRYDA